MSMEGFVTALVSLATAFVACGCASTGDGDAWQPGPPSQIRYRVFEVAAGDADAVIPTGSRRDVAESPYRVALVPAGTLDELTRLTRADTGPLVEHSRVIAGWPRVADTWSYSRADGRLLGGGGGGGFLGVRGTDGSRELRVDYQVNHFIDVVDRAGPGGPAAAARIDAPIFFKGSVGRNEAVVFVSPFRRMDGQELAHVIAFRIDRPG